MRRMYTESLGFTVPVLLGQNFPPGNKNKYRTSCKNTERSNPSVTTHQSSSILVQTDKNNIVSNSEKKPGPWNSTYLLGQQDTIGIIGGISVYSTLVFLEKLVWWCTTEGNRDCFPFVVCSDPSLNREIPDSKIQSSIDPVVENLRCKREFLEQSGARCIVMPCHLVHPWHEEVSKGSSVPFLHMGQCVALEIKEANMKPLEAGSNVRIGVLATSVTLTAAYYQKELQNQGFEVVLPDKSTLEHIINPAIKALNRKDMEGARNLLRIAIQLLLVKSANIVILASDEMLGILPRGDPLLKKCINPVDALVRSTIKWALSSKKSA